jgi:hypothetical protein
MFMHHEQSRIFENFVAQSDPNCLHLPACFFLSEANISASSDILLHPFVKLSPKLVAGVKGSDKRLRSNLANINGKILSTLEKFYMRT